MGRRVRVGPHHLPRAVSAVADPWIVLSAIAAATSRVRIGPLVTPLARRRVQKLARETVSLDLLSGGRLTLGVGLGSDNSGELGPFGEELDARKRAVLLDDGLERLAAMWSGEFAPAPVQQPRIPVGWRRAGPTAGRCAVRCVGMACSRSRCPVPRRWPSLRRRPPRPAAASRSTSWPRSGPGRTPGPGLRPAPPGCSPDSGDSRAWSRSARPSPPALSPPQVNL